jgi:GNAT superfamily N-acetyltransferase
MAVPGGPVPGIRRCGRGDFPAVADLLRQQWPHAGVHEVALRDAYERGLASPRQRYLCAELDSRVVGFGSLTLTSSLRQDGPVGRLDELVVDREYGCRGIDTSLMRAIEELAAGVGCTRLELDCDFHRKDEHAFFEQRQFERRALLFSKRLS